jgi:hypothetical protein
LNTYGKLPIMLYSRKLEQEKTEAPGEHAADTSYMYTFRQWASMKKKTIGIL